MRITGVRINQHTAKVSALMQAKPLFFTIVIPRYERRQFILLKRFSGIAYEKVYYVITNLKE